MTNYQHMTKIQNLNTNRTWKGRKTMKEIELNRYFKSVEAFWLYCEKMCAKHDITLTDWICDIEQFKRPLQKSDYRDDMEVCKLQPYDMQLFYKGSYNFIMEYDFWDDKEGYGYLYIKEF